MPLRGKEPMWPVSGQRFLGLQKTPVANSGMNSKQLAIAVLTLSVSEQNVFPMSTTEAPRASHSTLHLLGSESLSFFPRIFSTAYDFHIQLMQLF